jgi:predicted kinase
MANANAQLAEDIAVLRALVPVPLPRAARPVLVVLSGLPATGKSTFASRLAELVPCVVLESDALRKALVPKPTYTAEESRRVFAAIHALTVELLSGKHTVILDATNLKEAHRGPLHAIARRAKAGLVVVRLTAPERVVRARLSRRDAGQRDGASEAGWPVYLRLSAEQEPIAGEHVVVDSSQDMSAFLAAVADRVKALSTLPGSE